MRQKSGKVSRGYKVSQYLEEDDDGDEVVVTDVDVPHQRVTAPMSRHAKGLSDHIEPLRRWAAKQVGRPYNLAMSEIRKALGGGGGVLQQHVIDHLDSYITRPEEIQIVDGKAYHVLKFQRRDDPLTPVDKSELYADPRDGLIKRGWANQWRLSGPLRDGVTRQLKTLPHPPQHGQRVTVDEQYNSRWYYNRYVEYDAAIKSWVSHYDHNTSWNTWDNRVIEATEHVSQPVGAKGLRQLGLKLDTRRRHGRAGRRHARHHHRERTHQH